MKRLRGFVCFSVCFIIAANTISCDAQQQPNYIQIAVPAPVEQNVNVQGESAASSIEGYLQNVLCTLIPSLNTNPTALEYIMTVIKNIQYSAQHPEQLIKEYAGINNKLPPNAKVIVKREALVENPTNIAKEDNDLASSSTSESQTLGAGGENSTVLDNYLKDVFVSLVPSVKDRADLLDYLVSVVKYVDYAAKAPISPEGTLTESDNAEKGSKLDEIKEDISNPESAKSVNKRDVSAVTNNDDSITAKPEPSLGLKIESFIEEVELPPKKLETLPLDVIKHAVYNEMNSNDLKMSHTVYEQTTVIPITETAEATGIKQINNAEKTEIIKDISTEDLMYEITDLPPVLENTPLENPISTATHPKIFFQQSISTTHKYPEELTSSYFVEEIPVDDDTQRSVKDQNKIAKSSGESQYSKKLPQNSDLSEILKQNKRKISGHYAFDIIEEPFPNNLKVHQRMGEAENANYQKAMDFNRGAVFQEVVPIKLSLKEPELQPQGNDRNQFVQIEENVIREPIYVEQPKLEKLRQMEQLKQEKSQKLNKASTKKPIRKEVVIVFPKSEMDKVPSSEALVKEQQEIPVYVSDRPRPFYRSGRTIVRYPIDRPYPAYPLPRPVYHRPPLYSSEAPREVFAPAPYQPTNPRIVQYPPPLDPTYPPINSRPLNFPYHSRVPVTPSGLPTSTYYPTQTPAAVPQIPQRPVTISLNPQAPITVPQRPQTPVAIPQISQTPYAIPQLAQQYAFTPRYIPNYQFVNHIGNLQQVWINLITPYRAGYRYSPPVNVPSPPRDIVGHREVVEPDGRTIVEEVYENDEE